MYNPLNLNECEKEKKKRPRKIIDGTMTLIGGIASVSSVPQILKIWSTGNISGISLTTQLLALGAVMSWFMYGIYLKNKPLTITSGLSILVLGTVVVQILVYS